jgi:hypothetical protein
VCPQLSEEAFTTSFDHKGKGQDLTIHDPLASPDRYARLIRSIEVHDHALFDLARAQDVEKGGRYDARSAAINIYTHPWNTETMQEESTLMGSIYVFWAEENRLWRVEMEEGFSLEDLLLELGTLEEKALGEKVYGR